jgi:hypothetical protein
VGKDYPQKQVGNNHQNNGKRMGKYHPEIGYRMMYVLFVDLGKNHRVYMMGTTVFVLWREKLHLGDRVRKKKFGDRIKEDNLGDRVREDHFGDGMRTHNLKDTTRKDYIGDMESIWWDQKGIRYDPLTDRLKRQKNEGNNKPWCRLSLTVDSSAVSEIYVLE